MTIPIHLLICDVFRKRYLDSWGGVGGGGGGWGMGVGVGVGGGGWGGFRKIFHGGLRLRCSIVQGPFPDHEPILT